MEVSPPLEEDTESRMHLERIARDELEVIARERPFELNDGEFQRAIRELSGMPIAVSVDYRVTKNRTGSGQSGLMGSAALQNED